MPCSSAPLTIGDVVVQQDAHGRYSLNDLHRASGLEPRHQPAQFLRLGSTIEFIEELRREDRYGNSHIAPTEVVRGGPGQGTYVCKDLVYDYAMWISAEFRLKVIRAFDSMVRGVPDAQLVADAEALAAMPKSAILRLAAGLADTVETQAKQLEAQKPAVEFVDRFVAAKGSAGVRQVAKRINRKQNEFVAELLRDKVMYRVGKHLAPFAEYQHRGYFVVKNGEKNGHAFPHARFTPKGIEWAGRRYGREDVQAEPPVALALVPKQASLL